MTRDDIIRIAQESGIEIAADSNVAGFFDCIERFATLVATAAYKQQIEEMEKAEPEPVAWMDPNGDIYDEEYEVWKAWNAVGVKPKGFKPRPLYLHPAPTTNQEPVAEPNADQLTQVLNGLDRCFTRESKREFLRTWIRDFAQHAAPAIPNDWKDHNTAELVNELRDIAIKYRNTQQLRERIAHMIRPLAERLQRLNSPTAGSSLVKS